MPKVLMLLNFALLFALYYFMPGSEEAASSILTVSTFLFAIFAGFFIARQGNRYNEIRQQLSRYDGELTAIYRSIGHIDPSLQDQAKNIIRETHDKIIETGQWDYMFTHKTTTITDLHDLINDNIDNSELTDDDFLAAQNIITSLEQLQIVRKQLVSLHIERIPRFQWGFLILLAVILILTLSTIPTDSVLTGSILKAAFGSCVFLVLMLLWEFDNLVFFGDNIGTRSSQDMVDIFEGRK